MNVVSITEVLLSIRRINRAFQHASELNRQGDVHKSRKIAMRALDECKKVVRKAKTKRYRKHKKLIMQGIDSLKLVAAEIDMDIELETMLNDDPDIIDITPAGKKPRRKKSGALVGAHGGRTKSKKSSRKGAYKK